MSEADASIKLRSPPSNYRSKVWKYFGFREGVHDKPTCKLCFIDILCKTGNTTNLSNHLKRKHNINVTNVASANAVSAPSITTGASTSSSAAPKNPSASTSDMKIPEMFKFKQKLPTSSDRHKTLTEATGAFIALDMRPYSVVENKGFQYLMSIAEPRYNIPSRTHFAQTVIPGLYTRVKDRVISELGQCESVAITTDSWTSRATENYLTVTAHAINTADWSILSYTLETNAFSQSHTAINLSASLNNTVKLWDLKRHGKGPVVTTDNAMNIVKAVKLSELSHVPCFAHTLNLATQKGLGTMDRLLGKVRRVVGLFHRSTTAAATLKSVQSQLGVPEHKLLMDVATRWNSSFHMIERYLEQQAAIFASLLSKDVKKKLEDVVTLSDTDNQNLESAVKILGPINTATNLLCADNSPTVSLIHPMKEMLLLQMKVLPDDSSFTSVVKDAIMKDLLPRYTDPAVLDILHTAAALDPRFKSLPYVSSEERHNIFKSLSEKALEVADLQDEVKVIAEPSSPDDPSSSSVDYAAPALPVRTTLPVQSQDSGQQPGEEPPMKMQKLSPELNTSKSALESLFGDVFVSHVEPAKSVTQRVETEIESYQREATASVNSDPLQWWRERAGTYPILSKLACQYLVIPATSVASERVFSTAGDIVNAQRGTLSSDNVDVLIFLKKNMKLTDLN